MEYNSFDLFLGGLKVSEVKLLLFDNDGTLINDDRQLTKRTKDALEALHSKGYLLGLASGRTYENLSTYPKEWGLSFDFDVYIGQNGAELYDGVHHTHTIENYLTREQIIDICLKVEAFDVNGICAIQTFDDEHVYVYHCNEIVKQSFARNRIHEAVFCDDVEDMAKVKTTRVMIRIPEEHMAELEDYLAKHQNPTYTGYKTQPFVYEFVDIKTKKGHGVSMLQKAFGFKKNQIMSFGDTSNDNSMIEATYGVCMANGSYDTKALAKEITRYTNNEDGLADYLETHLL